MPQCKKNMCREPAVPGGKRYCEKHLAEYKRRRHEATKDLASCSCGSVVPRHLADKGMCQSCWDKHVNAERAASIERTKVRELDEATTVEDLKAWIREYVL